jgi:hypothetical protein
LEEHVLFAEGAGVVRGADDDVVFVKAVEVAASVDRASVVFVVAVMHTDEQDEVSYATMGTAEAPVP